MDTLRRKNPRAKSWDYATAACYHVVFCTHGRACVLGKVVDGACGCEVELTALGRLCEEAVGFAESCFKGSAVHVLCIMPNHVHLLVELSSGDRPTALGAFLGCMKRRVTKCARDEGLLSDDGKLWQRGYYDHIVRGSEDFERIGEYIRCNPGKWYEDKYYM